MRKLLLQLFAMLPLPVLHALANVMGWLLFSLRSKQRYITDINVRLCFPQLDTIQQLKLSRRSLIETSKMLLESFKLWLAPPQHVLALVKEVTGEKLIQQALEKKQGVLLLLPHLGNWEMFGIYCASRYPITSMYRPQRSAFFDQLIYAGRSRFGANMVSSDAEGVRALLKALKHNELAWIMPDQNPGAGAGVFVPFFGIQTNSPTLPSKLAHKTETTIISAYAERLSFGRGFHIHFSSVDPCIAQADFEAGARCVNHELERLIMQKPEQYWWSHNRFRHRPSGEADVY